MERVGAARFAHVLTLLIIGTAFSTYAIRSMIGWPGLVAIVSALVPLAALSMTARWKAVEWYGILPISMLVFIGWSAASLLWASDPGTTLWRVLYQVAFAALGVYVALMRDTIQVVRAVGDVLRVLLGLSILLEVLSGILLNLPIAFLGIDGNIAELGPIQGVFGSRNVLGMVALIAGVTFIIEWRTRSVQRRHAQWSVALAALSLVLSGSPTTFIALSAILLSAVALYGLRHVAPTTRWRWQIAAVVTVVVSALIAFLLRARIIDALNARSAFGVRIELWREMSRYLNQNPLQGWGWVGIWPREAPYTWIAGATGRSHASGLSGYIDIYFQLGVIGVLAFIALIALALVRSWLLASARRSVVYAWPALILVVLATTSLAESFVLVQAGWLLLIVCAVKAARDMSWRDALPRSSDTAS